MSFEMADNRLKNCWIPLKTSIDRVTRTMGRWLVAPLSRHNSRAIGFKHTPTKKKRGLRSVPGS